MVYQEIRSVRDGWRQMWDQCSSNTGWSYSHTSQQVKVWTKADPSCGSSIRVVKGAGVVSSSISSIANVVWDYNKRSWFDPACVRSELVEELDGDTQVVRQMFSAQRFCKTAGRELLICAHRKWLDPSVLVITARSVAHTAHPPPPDSAEVVRAHVHLGGWVIKAIGQGRCLVYYLIHIDLKGAIPSYFIGEVNKKQPLIIDNLRSLFTQT